MQINKLRLFVAILVLATAIFALVYLKGSITAKVIEEQQQQEFYESWLPENCSCLEKERIKCSLGFELVGNLCKNANERTFTNVLKACSKYDCTGTVYTFNQDKQIWEMNE